ncbi:hypothetical protein QBC33DRAFT_533213 [Phialemonium atrogriseum]|uniref:Uncharacterized protein n=1 Tax=Phialemonium atrogriseum TaxID=1093897 RepID=A0AAJ0FNU6_9PEZI|nr:uncharacterized protein QBC33DRAFT_533213 [Phialemonium atrogriseum]KAK1769379.1 hypothetical protein QBC33DRAFT_533213 [Phialemonium atrogriseum]
MTNHGSAISSPPASAPDTPDTGYTSTTTVVVELTSFVTVTETLDIGTSATPNSNSAQPISSGASDGVLTTTASPMTVQPVSHATSTTIFRTVTSTISGVAKTVTITETRAIGTGVGTEIGSSVLGTHSNPAPFSTTATALPTGVTATSGTLVTPAVSGNVTWNYTSTNPFPPGPASTTVFPLVSGGSSKPKTKGGNSGNGSSGGSCILMLAAIAVGFISL